MGGCPFIHSCCRGAAGTSGLATLVMVAGLGPLNGLPIIINEHLSLMLELLCAKEEHLRLDLLARIHDGRQAVETGWAQPLRDLLIDGLVGDPCHAIRLVSDAPATPGAPHPSFATLPH